MPSADQPATTPEPEARPSVRAWLRNGLIYLATLLLAALLVERFLPYPNIPGTSEKIRYLSLHGNDYDAIFTGSSRVNFQVLPSIFDRAMADSGRPVKSFNAGFLGMRPPEQGYFLDQVLEQPHRRLRWVFIELTSLEARTPKTRRGSARFLSWHDAERMKLIGTWTVNEWAALRAGMSRPGPNQIRWVHMWEPLSVWLMHFDFTCKQTLNIGRGEFLADTWIIQKSKRARELNKFRMLGKDKDGWMPYDGAREQMNEKERAAYVASYEARLVTPAVPFNDPASDQAVEAMRRAVIKAGATPIFFVPPMTTERHYYPPPELAKNMIIWNFCDPNRYPRLFIPEYRLDTIHMNSEGGKEFTKALAERFAELPR